MKRLIPIIVLVLLAGCKTQQVATTALLTTETSLVTQSMIDDLNALEEVSPKYTIEDFASNKELFLTNFRYFIANRLADKTGSSKLTITLSSAVYNAVHDDTTTYPNKKGGDPITTWNYLTATDGTGINWNVTSA